MASPNKIARTIQTEGVHSVHHQTTPTLITDLPEDVFHHISSYLSLQDLARMAVSSKTWRYICRTIPYLTINIDEQTPETISAGRTRKNCDYINFAERLLVLRHRLQIERFIYNTPVIPVSPYRVETLILHVLLSEVQELDLTFPWSMTYDLSREIFNLPSLRVLQLNMKGREFELPINAGCTKLQSLSVSHATLRHGWPLNITQCNLLKTLSLLDCSGITTLSIMSASLEKIHIRDPKEKGNLLHIDISCQKLTTLHIELYSVQDGRSFRLLAPDLQFFTWSGRAVSNWRSDSSPLTSLQTATMNLSPPLHPTSTVNWTVPLLFVDKVSAILSNAKSLRLCSLSMQILSLILMFRPSLSLSKVESMEVYTHFSMEENQYIFYLIWRLSNLKAFFANQEIDSNVSPPFKRSMTATIKKCAKLEFPRVKTSEIRLHGSGKKGSGENILQLVKDLVESGNMLEKLTVKYSQMDFDLAKRLGRELQCENPSRPTQNQLVRSGEDPEILY